MPRASLVSAIRVDAVDDRQPLGRHLILLFRAFEDEVLGALARLGYRDLTAADLNVIRFVRPEGSQAVEIARLAGISKQAVGRTVLSLQERGYLRRSTDASDARSKVIAFSPRGVRLLGAAIEAIRSIDARYERVLGAAGLARLRRDLAALLETHGEVDR